MVQGLYFKNQYYEITTKGNLFKYQPILAGLELSYVKKVEQKDQANLIPTYTDEQINDANDEIVACETLPFNSHLTQPCSVDVATIKVGLTFYTTGQEGSVAP